MLSKETYMINSRFQRDLSHWDVWLPDFCGFKPNGLAEIPRWSISAQQIENQSNLSGDWDVFVLEESKNYSLSLIYLEPNHKPCHECAVCL